jgi:hypothetical protein
MRYSDVCNLSNEKFKRIVGVKKSTFNLMLRILEVAYAFLHEFGGKPDKLPLEDKLIIALSYWREYRTYAHLGVTYGYSDSQVCRIVKWCEKTLIKSGKFNVEGKLELMKLNKENLTLIDVTESPIQRPKKEQKHYYSGKKKRHTLKTQIVVDKQLKKIICLHIENGKTHDFKIYKKSRLPINKESKVVTDSGYQGIQKILPNTEIPRKNTKKYKLTEEDKEFNRQLASKRVLNENVIAVLKVFKIIAEKYRNRRRGFSLRFNLIAGIYNFELGI